MIKKLSRDERWINESLPESARSRELIACQLSSYAFSVPSKTYSQDTELRFLEFTCDPMKEIVLNCNKDSLLQLFLRAQLNNAASSSSYILMSLTRQHNEQRLNCALEYFNKEAHLN